MTLWHKNRYLALITGQSLIPQSRPSASAKLIPAQTKKRFARWWNKPSLFFSQSITPHPFRRVTNLSRRLVVNWSPSFLMSVEEIVTSGTVWRDLKYIAIWWKHDFPQFSTMIVRIDEKKYLCRILGQGCLLTITGKEVSHQSMFCSKSRRFGFFTCFYPWN